MEKSQHQNRQSEEMSIKTELTTSIQTSKDQINNQLYFCSLIMGMAEPWNAIITCIYYFQLLYSPAGYKPQFTLPMIIFFPLVGFQIVMIAYGKHFTIRTKLVGGLAFLTFFTHIFLLLAKGIPNLYLSFYIAILNTLIIGVFNAIVQGAVCGLIGALGGNGKYMGAAMLGNGIAGILYNLIQFLCLAVIGNEDSDMFKVTMLFFILVAFFMIASTYIGYIMVENPLAIDAVKKSPKCRSIKQIFGLCWPVFKSQGKNVFICCTFTMIIYPGVFLAKPLECFSKQWSIPLMILIFNISAAIGRFFPSVFIFISPANNFWFNSLRAISSFSICLIGYGAFNNFFVTDWWIITNIIIFGFTDGYGSTLAMIYGTVQFEDKYKEDAGKMMIFFLTGGIWFGSFLAQIILANIF